MRIFFLISFLIYSKLIFSSVFTYDLNGEKITNFKDQKMEFDKYNAEGEQPEMPMEESSEKPAPTGLMARQETA